MEIFDSIPFVLSPGTVIQDMKMRVVPPDLKNLVSGVIERISQAAKPKAVFKEAFIKSRTYETVDIDGITFTSRVLVVNLQNAERVFPFVITSGREADEIKAESDNFMETFILDLVKEYVLREAGEYVMNHFKSRYVIQQAAYMEPGSLSTWPIQQQKQLFTLLGDVERAIGVKLNESYLMQPVKTISGIYFPTEVEFESCMLCPQEGCSHRKAQYNPSMFKRYS